MRIFALSVVFMLLTSMLIACNGSLNPGGENPSPSGSPTAQQIPLPDSYPTTFEETETLKEINYPSKMKGYKSAGGRKYYVPEEGAMVFAGQDLQSVGGLPNYADGYIDSFGMPMGVTAYFNFPSLNGLNAVTNWGAGDTGVSAFKDRPEFKNTFIALGMSLPYANSFEMQRIINGTYDMDIVQLAQFIKSCKSTVFLRIGYEFDGSWNGYIAAQYIKVFQHIVRLLDKRGVDNYVTVWQASDQYYNLSLMNWYPGDEFVDFIGYSYFNYRTDEVGQALLSIARERHKPVFIAEVTPKGFYAPRDDGEQWWNNWYNGFVRHVLDNNDVIKAFSYINCNWMAQPMWQTNNTGDWGDTRIQENATITERWKVLLASEKFLHQIIIK